MNNEFSPEIEHIIKGLSLDEKIQLCHAATKFSVKGIPHAGIPDIIMSDGPHGVRREISQDSWDPVDTDDDFSTYLPVGTAVASTWNPEMGKLHGKILGSEARERRKDIILGPGFNIIRTPLCGRNFEYYSEDPYLISALVPGVVQAIQKEGTAACVKHYACNSQELNRSQVNAIPSERALREIYLPGFKAAADAGVLTFMGAYNKFRGQWCCQNDTLLNEILKKEWKFPGAVISDWAGVMYNTYEPAYGGMDIEMGTNKPYNEYHLADAFKKAIQDGEIDEAVLDDKVHRILYVLFSIGAMGAKSSSRPKGQRNTPEHQTGALAIAEEAVILLKNDCNTLPLSRNLKKILVVGNNGVVEHHGGGASSAVKSLYEITPLEGLKKYLGDSVEVKYLPDPAPADGFSIPTTALSPADTKAGVNGWKALVFNHRAYRVDQKPVHEFAVNEVDFSWEKELPRGVEDMNWHMGFITTLTAPEDGEYQFVLHGARHAGLNVDGGPLVLRRETETEPEVVSEKITLSKGKTYELLLYLIPNASGSEKRVRLNWLKPGEEAETSMDTLLEKAAEADAVVYAGGLTHQEDTEGKDRVSLHLPGLQDEVISALAEVQKNLVCLMIGGSPYAMPWIEKVPAVVHMGFAGMEGGTAAARVLFGEVNPSGKLPYTFPVRIEDSPAHYLDDYNKDICYYKEDIYVGYRWFDKKGIDPLFCFGHGLSYTDFEYSQITIDEKQTGQWEVSFDLTNTGTCAGAEVAQLYLQDPECSVGRPIRELKGFNKVFLKPGEKERVSFLLTVDDLKFFHPVKRCWTAEKGSFVVFIGSSSRDLRLSGEFTY